MVCHKLPNRGCPTIAEKMSKSCRNVASGQKLPNSCPGRRDSCKSWPDVGRLRPMLVRLWPMSANIGRCGSTFGRSLPQTGETGQRLAQIRHTSANVWPRCRPMLAELDRKLSKCCRPRTNSADPGQHAANFGQKLGSRGNVSATCVCDLSATVGHP